MNRSNILRTSRSQLGFFHRHSAPPPAPDSLSAHLPLTYGMLKHTATLTRSARNVRVDRDWHNKVLFLSVQILEMVFPLLFNDMSVDESV